MVLLMRSARAEEWAAGAVADSAVVVVAAAGSEASAEVSGCTLGSSFLAGAALLAVLMVAWLAVSGACGGGIVLGLMLLVVLAGPLAVAGIVVLQREPAEAKAEAVFTSKRRLLE